MVEQFEKEWFGRKIKIISEGDYAKKTSMESVAYLPEALNLLGKINSFLDIGANIGLTSLLVNSLRPSVDITCIEAHPRTAEYLEENLRLNDVKNAVVLNVAASNEEGTINFRDIAHASQGNSIVVDNSALNAAVPIIRIPSVRLDDVLHGVYDLIKIDVEGFELPALLGAEYLVKNSRAVLIEFNHWALSNNGCILPQEMLKKLNCMFERLYWFNKKDGNFQIIKTKQQMLRFLHDNMVNRNVDDLIGINDESLIV